MAEKPQSVLYSRNALPPAVPVATHDAPASNSLPPADWSDLGRRVLAEAWRRTTDELAARGRLGVSPVVLAPPGEGAQ